MGSFWSALSGQVSGAKKTSDGNRGRDRAGGIDGGAGASGGDGGAGGCDGGGGGCGGGGC
ncbi:hypothetical protein A2U01_0049941 [Trifolium medium]|uniref:Uncharacterized protein n=1 Tax=Trifolium medium TaxID=97028 RepID=A0A392QXN4_9FABA|nr:hypothetical protein [Trifolium medium]